MTASSPSSDNHRPTPTLSGLSVLVTRAENQADELTTRLNQEGATVYALPLLAFQAPKDCGELDAALKNLSSFNWIIFASKNAVEFTFERLEKLAKEGQLEPGSSLGASLGSSLAFSRGSSPTSSPDFTPDFSRDASPDSTPSFSRDPSPDFLLNASPNSHLPPSGQPSAAAASALPGLSLSASISNSDAPATTRPPEAFPQIAVIGSGTARALERHNLKADFIPPAFVAESLVEHFPQAFPLKNKKILWLKTNIGRPLIKTELEKTEAEVTAITVYETNLPANSRAIGENLRNLLEQEKIDVITVASAQTARNLARVLGESLAAPPSTESLEAQLKKVKIAAIGPITARACRENLGKADLIASEYNLDGLVNLLATFNTKNHETLGINKNQITI